MSEVNFIFGGFCGYSAGKYKWALKKPPSLQKTDGINGKKFFSHNPSATRNCFLDLTN